MNNPILNKSFFAIEGGGTKFLIAHFDENCQELARKTIATKEPEQTLGDCVAFIKDRLPGKEHLAGLGIAHFGPLSILPDAPDYGKLRETPKVAWSHFDVLGFFKQSLGDDFPIIIDTDVNGAVLAETRWGAGKGLKNVLYLTIGTGIGGGAIVNRKLLYGYAHTEMGHIAIPRLPNDTFAGICPAHGDCFEGLCTGPAIAVRWDRPATDLPDKHPAWPLEAAYIAKALRNYAYVLAPERIVLGGGVMNRRFLFPLIREAFKREMAGYGETISDLKNYIVPSEFKGDAGLFGALCLILDFLTIQN